MTTENQHEEQHSSGKQRLLYSRGLLVDGGDLHIRSVARPRGGGLSPRTRLVRGTQRLSDQYQSPPFLCLGYQSVARGADQPMDRRFQGFKSLSDDRR